MRRLKQTLLAGGVVYPAGTLEDDIEVAVARDDVWDDTDIDVPESVREVDESDHPVTAELREVCEYLIEAHLADKDVPVAQLLAGAVEVFAPEDADETEEDESDEGERDPQTGAVPPTPAPAYAEQSLADLKAAAESRAIEFKGSGANGKIVKADTDALIAALEADDAAKA